jgi:hypothetical protein
MAVVNPKERASAAQMLVKYDKGVGLSTPRNQVPALINSPVATITPTPAPALYKQNRGYRMRTCLQPLLSTVSRKPVVPSSHNEPLASYKICASNQLELNFHNSRSSNGSSRLAYWLEL